MSACFCQHQTSTSEHEQEPQAHAHHKNTKRGYFILATFLTIQRAHALPYWTVSSHRSSNMLFQIAQTQEFCWHFITLARLTSKLVVSNFARCGQTHRQHERSQNVHLQKDQIFPPFDAKNKNMC